MLPGLSIARRPPAAPITPDHPDTQLVSRDFLTAMALPVVAGRAFGDADGAGQPQVMLINRSLARSGFFGEQPVGKQVYALGPRPWEIIGIVEDVRQSSLIESPTPQIFIDYRQVPRDEPMAGVGLYFSVRADSDLDALAASVRTLTLQIDSQAMIENTAPMNQLVATSLSRPRLLAVLLGLFASVAIVLAAIGIYGVMAYAVTQRTREIGIRVALGARTVRVLGLVIGQSAVIVLVGVILGVAGALSVTRYLRELLFGLSPFDPATFIGVTVLFALIAMIAAFVPSWRATRVDPLVALRFE
jgi:putative ABC transport system permease protein